MSDASDPGAVMPGGRTCTPALCPCVNPRAALGNARHDVRAMGSSELPTCFISDVVPQEGGTV